MVQVDISTQPRVLASTCTDVATLMSHPVLGDCMIVDQSSPLCDDVESTPTPSVTVLVNTGTTGVGCGTGGTCGTVVASSQDDPKATASVDDTKIPLWLTWSGHSSPCVRTRLELGQYFAWSSQSRKPRTSSLLCDCMLMDNIPSGRCWQKNWRQRGFLRSPKPPFPWFWKQVKRWCVLQMEKSCLPLWRIMGIQYSRVYWRAEPLLKSQRCLVAIFEWWSPPRMLVNSWSASR